MNRLGIGFACLILISSLYAAGAQITHAPEIDYETAAKHELPPHRYVIPALGIQEGSLGD
jgi:hypothetical protein